MASASAWLAGQCFPFPLGPHPRKLRPPAAATCPACSTTSRPITAPQKLPWILLRKAWAEWKRPLILVTPRTVVGWHRAGFGSIGGGSPQSGRQPVESRSAQRFGPSSFRWLPRIQLGACPAFMASCAGFDLSQATVARDGCHEHPDLPSSLIAASPFCGSSRGDGRPGLLLHPPDPYLRRTVRFSPSSSTTVVESGRRRNSEPSCILGWDAAVRNLERGPRAATLLALRSGFKVQCRCRFDREGRRQPACLTGRLGVLHHLYTGAA